MNVNDWSLISPCCRSFTFAGLCEAGRELNQGEMDTATVQSLVQQSPLAKPAQVAPISPCLSCPCNILEILQSLAL
jgi:hypothetical protein